MKTLLMLCKKDTPNSVEVNERRYVTEKRV